AQDGEAGIEYSNVLQIDRTNARAERQLALAYYQLGDFRRAYPYFVKFAETEPDNVDMRIKLARIYFLGRRPAEAQGQVAAVLTNEPKNLEAALLLAAMATTPVEIDAALKLVEEARADFGDKAKLHMAAGILYVRKQDMANAERAFREAVAREPKSVEAHTALG